MICIYARCGREIPDGSVFCPWCGRKQIKETRKKRRRKKGTGTVYKLDTKGRRKKWIAVISGHSIGYFSTEREALDALELYIAVDDVELFDLTMEGVYNKWGESAYTGCTPSFANDYKNAWKHFPQKLRSRLFREIKTADVQSVIDKLNRSGKSKSVQNKVKSLYSYLCKFGMSNDLIEKNYASFLKVYETKRKKDSSVFTLDELNIVMRYAAGDPLDREVQTARIIMIYLFTGMRLNELLPLECSAIHLDAEYPHLIGGIKTEAGRDRVVPIISTIQPYVKWFLDHATSDKLFSVYMGNKDPKHWREREYKPLLEKLGIPYHTPHGTRRTTATFAVEKMVDPAALQKIGGWREFDTIQKHYNKPNVAYLYNEMSKLESLIRE